MIRLILFTLFLKVALLSSAQNYKDDNNLRTLAKLDIGFQGIGFTFEPRLSNKITVDLSSGAGGGYQVAEGSLNYHLVITQPAYYFSATPKFFYNRQRRIEKGKKSQLNAGNYFGVRLTLTTANIGSKNFTSESGFINVHWGIQREIGKRWMLNTHTGIGYAKDLASQFGTIYPAIGFKLSYAIWK